MAACSASWVPQPIQSFLPRSLALFLVAASNLSLASPRSECWSSRHQQSPHLWAKESPQIAASPVLVISLHLLDCILYCSNMFHCFISIDRPVLLAVEELWIMDCTLGIQVGPPRSTSYALCDQTMNIESRDWGSRCQSERHHGQLLHQGRWTCSAPCR